ncbi:hypothetical protein [Vibrio phage JSF7]|uniref:Uncharacterized protein n=1 Tax=Vibrio phage JSF7 TaxID=1292086 RepID=A0A240EWU6_9CAUD|nr:hypothetical protein HOQ92_gp13 [Vibrio phage JSF7]APD18137.1 hypothetical protein [Vibrio phage JSF7]
MEMVSMVAITLPECKLELHSGWVILEGFVHNGKAILAVQENKCNPKELITIRAYYGEEPFKDTSEYTHSYIAPIMLHGTPRFLFQLVAKSSRH